MTDESTEGAAAALALPRNVTGRFSDLAPEDAVYETTDGYLIKVKVLWDDTAITDDPGLAYRSQHGAERFTVTGSIVGADGKTLRRDTGDHAIHDLRRGHTHHADRDQDPAIGIEIARLKCVADTVRAEKHYQMLAGGYTPGVVSKGQQAERKAAEAVAQLALIMGDADAVS